MLSLLRFQVRGWVRASGRYLPLTQVEVIDAENGISAARIYAALYNIRESQWFDAGPRPPVVIRVSNEGEAVP